MTCAFGGQGSIPDAVDDAFVDAYMDYRRRVLGQDAGPVVRRRIVLAWNDCAAEHPGWPPRRLTPPPRAARGVIPWEAFPATLRADVDAWLDGRNKLRRAANGARRKPAKPTTLRTRFAELQAFTRRAVAVGQPIAELRSLAALLDPGLVEKVIDAMCGDEAPKASVIDLGWRLHHLAEATSCLPPAALARLKDVRDALNDQRATGMTQKNLAVVRTVMTSAVWKEIIALPRKLIEQARRELNSAPVRAGLRAQRALGIALLTFMPVRIGNLANLRLGVHLLRPNGRAGEYLLAIPGIEVKNNVDIECPFDDELSGLIDIYLREFRPHLMHGANHDFLFPGRFGDARRLASFSSRIAETVEQAIGLRITAHQFRHAAAAVILRNDPGNYEFVRRILGHKSTKTTREFYIALDAIGAGRRYGESLRGAHP